MESNRRKRACSGCSVGGGSRSVSFTPYFGNDFCDVGGAWAHLRLQPFGVSLLNIGPDGLHPGPVGGCALFLVAPAPQDLDAPGFSVGSQLLGGASLANTRLPHQHGQPAPTGQRLFQGRPELAQLPLAADEDTGGGDGLAAGLRRRLRHAASIVGIGGGFQWLILRSMISKTRAPDPGWKRNFRVLPNPVGWRGAESTNAGGAFPYRLQGIPQPIYSLFQLGQRTFGFFNPAG